MAVEKGLLLHWWHYYGKEIYTLEELNKFEEIIDKYGTEKILEFAIASYIVSNGSPTIMLMSIRDNNTDEFIKALPDPSKYVGKQKQAYEELKQSFIKVITSTYH